MNHNKQEYEPPMLDQISNILDDNIYSPLYSQYASQMELSISGLAAIAASKVCKKLVPIKVGCFVAGCLFLISSIRFLSQNHIRGGYYLIIAYDLFRVSYNSYHRSYFSIMGHQTLSSVSSLANTLKSFFNSNGSDATSQVSEFVNWNYLLDGTCTLWCGDKVRRPNKIALISCAFQISSFMATRAAPAPDVRTK
jgi:hypothetical protein